LLHALNQLRDKEVLDPDLVVFLQATSPLRRDGEIQEAIDTLRREEADSLLSVGPMHGFVWRNGDNGVEALNYDYRNRPRRQDAPEDLIENGSIYLFRPWVLREQGNRLGGKIAVHRMRSLESFQIDDPEDFELIELILRSQPPSRQVPDFSAVELLVLDFDGVFTDNRVLVDEHGKEAVLCHRGDGLGLEQVRTTGLEVVVLSKETNPVVTARCEKLELPCRQSCDDKRTALQQMATERGLDANQIAFMGNDVNDVEGLRWVGMPLAVADAVPAVRGVAQYVTVRRGGEGAVREVCDMIMKQRAEAAA
jgi:N-acylneuraminate cytidylyltransferase